MFRIKSKVSNGDNNTTTEIHLAVSKEDISSIQRLLKNGIDANEKDGDGKTPLHYAAVSGNLDIVRILLDNGADVTNTTDNGETPLHLAASKGHKEIVSALLQYIERYQITGFLNAKSFYSGETALHLAAKRSGSLQVVKLLLKHGASFDLGNVEGTAPIALSKDLEIIGLLELIEQMFSDTKNGNMEIVAKLNKLERDDVETVLNTRDKQEHTLLQIAIANKQKDMTQQLLKFLKNLNKTSNVYQNLDIDTLHILINITKCHLSFSASYLPVLRNNSFPHGDGINDTPWYALKKGSYFLGNAFDVIKRYKECVPGEIENEHIKVVNETLVELGFDRSHISIGFTDEAYGGKVECFVSKGQGKKYYNLLHSTKTQDVRLFIEIVETQIDQPLRRFLKSTQTIVRDILKELKSASEYHMRSSNVYLPMLRQLSHPMVIDKNPYRWKCLKEGSYYLGNVLRFVNTCKNYISSTIDDANVKIVHDTLEDLEFDSKHISSGLTDEAYDGKVECFVSLGQNKKYYNLLHSEWVKDVRLFIEIAEEKFDKPIIQFLESIEKKLDQLEKPWVNWGPSFKI